MGGSGGLGAERVRCTPFYTVYLVVGPDAQWALGATVTGWWLECERWLWLAVNRQSGSWQQDSCLRPACQGPWKTRKNGYLWREAAV